MSHLIYHPQKVVLMTNTKCCQTTLQTYFGASWAQKKGIFGNDPDGLYDGSKRSIPLSEIQKVYHRRDERKGPIYNKDAYFYFTFVRNPWGRMVSQYYYAKIDDVQPFDEYIKISHEYKMRGKLGPQSYVMDLVELVDVPLDRIDFVGYYRTFIDDVKKLHEILGIEYIPENFPHSNFSHSSNLDYRTMYTDETRQMVAEMYAEDIAKFGFDFDKDINDRSKIR